MTESDPDIVALAEALRPAVLRVSRRLRHAAQRLGLSAQDVSLLVQVRKKPGIGVSALAEAEGISKPTMSAHAKRLAEAGLLARADDADDGRRSGLTVTAAGDAALEAIRQGRNDWLASRLLRLSPQERDALARAAPALLRLAQR